MTAFASSPKSRSPCGENPTKAGDFLLENSLLTIAMGVRPGFTRETFKDSWPRSTLNTHASHGDTPNERIKKDDNNRIQQGRGEDICVKAAAMAAEQRVCCDRDEMSLELALWNPGPGRERGEGAPGGTPVTHHLTDAKNVLSFPRAGFPKPNSGRAIRPSPASERTFLTKQEVVWGFLS